MVFPGMSGLLSPMFSVCGGVGMVCAAGKRLRPCSIAPERRQVPAEVGEVEQRRTAHGELPIQHGGDFAVFGEQIRRIEIPVDQHRRFGFGAGKAAEPGDPVVSQPPLNGGVGVHDFVELPEWPRFHSAIREEAAGFGKTEPAEPAEYSPR